MLFIRIKERTMKRFTILVESSHFLILVSVYLLEIKCEKSRTIHNSKAHLLYMSPNDYEDFFNLVLEI